MSLAFGITHPHVGGRTDSLASKEGVVGFVQGSASPTARTHF